MRRVLITLIVLIALGEAALVVALSQAPQISTLEIDRDRAALEAELTKAEAEFAEYSGGAIKTLIELRIAVLKNTRAMLDQKRTSFIRMITINYTIDGQAAREASDKELNEILSDLAAAEQTIAAAKTEADQYSGGLIRVMALMKAATEEV